MNPNETPNPMNPNNIPGGATPPPTQPQSGAFVSGGPAQPSMPTGSGPISGGGKRKTIVMVVVILIIVVVALGIFFATKKPSGKTSGTSSSNAAVQSSKLAAQLNLLSQYGNHLQAANVAKFDKTALFYAVFKNAAAQTVVHTTNDRYEGFTATDQATRKLENIYQTSFNYHTKQLAEETQDPAGSFFERCVNGKNYTYDNVNTNSWQAETGATASCSDPTGYVNDINDGINTGGLTSAQAQTFVSTIAGTNGLVSVDDMKYVTHAGTPYIRLTVTVHPVSVGDGYQGMGVILGAFKATGVNSITWPYDIIGSNATGAKLIYYVNPATQLPAYSQIGLTYYLDATGKQTPNQSYEFQDTVYSFGGSVQALSTTTPPQKATLSWPEEQL